jgi:hypothetical protein
MEWSSRIDRPMCQACPVTSPPRAALDTQRIIYTMTAVYDFMVYIQYSTLRVASPISLLQCKPS